MISLITISVIAAAFTPVITKKLSASSITVGSMGGGEITEFAPDCSAWGDDCTLCTSKSCALCVKLFFRSSEACLRFFNMAIFFKKYYNVLKKEGL